MAAPTPPWSAGTAAALAPRESALWAIALDAPKLAAGQPGGVASFLLALWPTIPAEEAAIRRGATSATRQSTIEDNGIDSGAS
jgi:hypothetical protein